MSEEYKEKVRRAALRQFKSEFKVTQRGVLGIIGSGSEQTIAKYLGQIKEELKEKELAVFSPDMPPELIPVLEGIYHTSLGYAVSALDEERSEFKALADEAIRDRDAMLRKFEEEEKAGHSKDLEMIKLRNQVQNLSDKLVDNKAALLQAQNDIARGEAELEKTITLNATSRLKLKAVHTGLVSEIKDEHGKQLAKVEVGLAKTEVEKNELAAQVSFERQRSEEETARLYRDIDALKQQHIEERSQIGGVVKKLESELTLHHARENRDLGVRAKLENKIEELSKIISEERTLEQERVTLLKSRIKELEADAASHEK